MTEIVSVRRETEQRRLAPAVDPELAHLANVLRDFHDSYAAIRTDGPKLLDRFETLDRARRELLRHGINLGVDLSEIDLAPIDAALRRWREATRDRSLDPPEFVR